MTDNEIIKALEVHSNEKFDNCEGCPYLEGDSCEGFAKYSKPYRDVLDLINRQKTEIEILIRKKETLRDEIAELQAENERLNKEIDRLSQCVMYHDGQIVDAIKEFAEKLKERYAKYEAYETLYAHYIWNDIDNLVNKLTYQPTKIEHNSLCETETYESR